MRVHVPVHLRWSDLDAYDHVNNARVLTILEEARVRAFWAGPGLDGDEPRPLAVVEGGRASATHTLIGGHEIEYLHPIPYTVDPVEVQLWFSRLGGASAEVCYEVYGPGAPERRAERVCYLRARSSMVFVRAETGRPRRIDARERAAWEPYLEAPPRFRARE